jgi:hypothetical protein
MGWVAWPGGLGWRGGLGGYLDGAGWLAIRAVETSLSRACMRAVGGRLRSCVRHMYGRGMRLARASEQHCTGLVAPSNHLPSLRSALLRCAAQRDGSRRLLPTRLSPDNCQRVWSWYLRLPPTPFKRISISLFEVKSLRSNALILRIGYTPYHRLRRMRKLYAASVRVLCAVNLVNLCAT